MESIYQEQASTLLGSFDTIILSNTLSLATVRNYVGDHFTSQLLIERMRGGAASIIQIARTCLTASNITEHHDANHKKNHHWSV